jgi:hypothetical protein
MLVAALLALGGYYVLAHSALRPQDWPEWLLTADLLAVLDVEGVVLVFALLHHAYWLSYAALIPEAWSFQRIAAGLLAAQRHGDRASQRRFWFLYGGNMAIWAAAATIALRYWLPVR